MDSIDSMERKKPKFIALRSSMYKSIPVLRPTPEEQHSKYNHESMRVYE
jgi:hypothetical protein